MSEIKKRHFLHFQFTNYHSGVEYVLPGGAFSGFYINGIAHGEVWIQMIGGGLLHGTINDDANHLLTGNNVTYLYPDFETMLYGKFVDMKMIKAKEASLLEIQCRFGMPTITKFEIADSPIEYYYKPPTNTSYGAGPEGVRDPFERKNLILAESTIPNSGEGKLLISEYWAQVTGTFKKMNVTLSRLSSNNINSNNICMPILFSGIFSTVDWTIQKDQPVLVALYNQYIYTPEQLTFLYKSCHFNISKSDDERRHCQKYAISQCSGKMFNLPSHLDTPDHFHSTLGPKVNHHFRLTNTFFQCVESPRWGLIQGIHKLKDVVIRKNDELFSNYGYRKGSDFPFDFPWFHALKIRTEKEILMEKEEEERRLKMKDKRRKRNKNNKKETKKQ